MGRANGRREEGNITCPPVEDFKLIKTPEYWYDFNDYMWRSKDHFHCVGDDSPLFTSVKKIYQRLRHYKVLHIDEIPAFVKAVYLSTWL